MGDLLSTGLAHFAAVMVELSRLFASQISSRWSESFGFMASGTLKAMMLYDLFRNSAFDPILSHIFLWLSWFDSQVAVSSFSASMMMPPLLVLVTDRILPVD